MTHWDAVKGNPRPLIGPGAPLQAADWLTVTGDGSAAQCHM